MMTAEDHDRLIEIATKVDRVLDVLEGANGRPGLVDRVGGLEKHSITVKSFMAVIGLLSAMVAAIASAYAALLRQ